MQTTQLSSIFSDEERQALLEIYYSHKEYDTEAMKKAPVCDHTLDIVQDRIRQLIGTDYEYVSGNYYEHTKPFYPHTDFRKEWVESINMVIPLKNRTENYNGKLVIFDQMWEDDSQTWMMTHPTTQYTVNTALSGCPFDYPITNKTGEKMDQMFWETHLKQFPSWCWNELSGHTYRYEENSIIIFNNKKIHCTNNFKGSKTGLTLRYKKRHTNPLFKEYANVS